MSLDRAIGEQARSLGDFRRARGAASAWSDKQRTKLDNLRLGPLEDAGQDLASALKRAAEQLTSVRRLLT